jgi:hypothetical protein
MAQKKAASPTSAALAVAGADQQALAPVATLSALKWFASGKLTEDERGAVISETNSLAQSLLIHHNSGMRVGEHLTTIQGILEPHSLFGRYLKTFHFSKKSAYRYMKQWNNAKTLPAPIVQAAMARNIQIGGDTDVRPYGAYTEAVKKLPPPSNPTTEQAETWLAQVEEVRKEVKQSAADAFGTPGGEDFSMPEPTDPQTALKEAFRFVRNRYRQLPNNSKMRAGWLRTLVGMMLTELGVSGQQAFNPVAVPEDFRQGRGAPAKKAAVA